MAEEASLIRADVESAKLSNETVTSPSSQKALKRVAMAVVPLAFLAAVCYFSMPGVQSVPSAVRDTVGLSGSGSTWWDPIEQCTKVFQEVMDNDLGKLAFGEFNFETQELKMKDITTAEEAAKALQDPYTNFVHVGKCGFENRAVVWLYPDHSGDPSSAFLMANGECQRLTTQFLDKDDSAECVAVYRVTSPKWGGEALNHFHGPNTVTHAVVGGHGSDSTMHDGVLVMSHMIYLRGVHSTDSMALVDTLHTKLTMHGTVFLDSCFAGINGIAEMFSQKMPEHWVMGGVVSLESYIKVHPTPFDGSAESGPTQVTSEIAEDKVIDPNVPMDASYGYPTPSFVEGLIIETDSKSKMSEDRSYYKKGERMVAWLGGKNMGSVTQWLYPSNNGKVLKIGASVKTVKSFQAYRMEASGTSALGIFPQKLPEGLKGKVVFLHSIGNAPTSGNALITFDLPTAFQETDTTGGAGQTLGALLVLTTDFQHLEITEWKSWSQVPDWFVHVMSALSAWNIMKPLVQCPKRKGHPEILSNDPIWRAYSSDGLVQPSTTVVQVVATDMFWTASFNTTDSPSTEFWIPAEVDVLKQSLRDYNAAATLGAQTLWIAGWILLWVWMVNEVLGLLGVIPLLAVHIWLGTSVWMMICI